MQTIDLDKLGAESIEFTHGGQSHRIEIVRAKIALEDIQVATRNSSLETCERFAAWLGGLWGFQPTVSQTWLIVNAVTEAFKQLKKNFDTHYGSIFISPGSEDVLPPHNGSQQNPSSG